MTERPINTRVEELERGMARILETDAPLPEQGDPLVIVPVGAVLVLALAALAAVVLFLLARYG